MKSVFFIESRLIFNIFYCFFWGGGVGGGGEGEDMVLKKQQVEFQGLVKNNVEFPRVIKKKSCGVSRVFGFRS